MRDPTDKVITAATARAEYLLDELVDTLGKTDDLLGVARSLLIHNNHRCEPFKAKFGNRRRARPTAGIGIFRCGDDCDDAPVKPTVRRTGETKFWKGSKDLS